MSILQGLVGRVKEWLTPSTWTNYFRSDDEASTSQQSHDQVPARKRPVPNQLKHRPQKSEALTSETVMVCEDSTAGDSRALNPADHTSSPANHNRAVSFADHTNPPVAPGRGQFAPSHSFNKPQLGPNRNHMRKLSLGTFNNVKYRAHSSEPDIGHSSDDSDASWVAEANNEGADMVDLTTANISNGSNESWIAEENEPLPTCSGDPRPPPPRPISISLAQKELSLLTKGAPNTTTHSYLVGEGEAGITQGSAFLVTPGAEVSVHCIANPAYTNRPPHVTSPEGGDSSVYLRTSANKPVMTSTALRHGGKLSTAAVRTAAVSAFVSPVQQEVVSICNSHAVLLNL